jgi:hypothetical protein
MLIDNRLAYPIFALLILSLTLLFVPRQEIKKLFWFSLLWGSTADIVLILLFRCLHLYQYLKLSPYDFFGAPMWLPLAWSPAVILYIYFFPARKEWYYIIFYITAFAVIGTAIGMFFTQIGLLKEIHWHPLLRFPVQFIWFYGAMRHYRYLESTGNNTWR